MDSDRNFYEDKLLSHKLLEFEQIDSTNDCLERLISVSKVPSGSILRSDFQSMGKGMLNNGWESEKGKNLLFSMLLHPSFLKAHEQFYLSKLLSLAILSALSDKLPGKICQIKWPNDLLVEGRKISGTLIKSSLKGEEIQYCILGTGINVNQSSFVVDFKANSMYLETGKEFNIRALLESIIGHFDNLYESLKSGERTSINKMYLHNLFGYQMWHMYFNEKLGAFKGKITTIAEDGRMFLEDSNGNNHTFDVKEVSLVSG